MKIIFWVSIYTLLTSCSRSANVSDPYLDDEEFLLHKFIEPIGLATSDSRNIGRWASENDEASLYGILLFGNNKALGGKSCAKWSFLLSGGDLVRTLRVENNDSINGTQMGKVQVTATTHSLEDGFVFRIARSGALPTAITLSGNVSACNGEDSEPISMDLKPVNNRLPFRETFLSNKVSIRGLILEGRYKLKRQAKDLACTIKTSSSFTTLGERVSFDILGPSTTPLRLLYARNRYLFDDSSGFKLARDATFIRGIEVSKISSGTVLTSVWRFTIVDQMASQEKRHLSEYPGGMTITFRVLDANKMEGECSTSIKFRPFNYD